MHRGLGGSSPPTASPTCTLYFSSPASGAQLVLQPHTRLLGTRQAVQAGPELGGRREARKPGFPWVASPHPEAASGGASWGLHRKGVRVATLTFVGFTLSDKKGARLIDWSQKLSLSIFPAN